MSKRFGDFDELVLTRCLLPGIQVLLGRIRAFDDAVIHDFASRVVESIHTASGNSTFATGATTGGGFAVGKNELLKK
jgi:hypothetical protein